MSQEHPGFLPVDDYLKQPRSKDAWLLKPLLPVGGAALLYGESKVGKSYLGIQLALALSGQAPDFLGFPLHQFGKVLYLQLDTPRSVWGLRFEEMLTKGKLKYDSNLLLLADRDSIEKFPFDILQPDHVIYLQSIVQYHKPAAVIIDTLRECHSGDEDSSTTNRNIISNLTAAVNPSALVIISHSRKPHPDVDKDLLADHRGSSYIVGRMDAIMRLTKSKLYFTGRSIEAGDIRVSRADNGLWIPVVEESEKIALEKVITDPKLPTLNEKAKALAQLIGLTEEAARSRIRRSDAWKNLTKATSLDKEGVDNTQNP